MPFQAKPKSAFRFGSADNSFKDREEEVRPSLSFGWPKFLAGVRKEGFPFFLSGQ